MSARIAGMGWITPLGSGLEEVWTRLENGERGEVRELSTPNSTRKQFYMAVPPGLTKTVERLPRLRRSSAISLFTAAAGLAALENAGIQMTAEIAERTGVVFAIASGGVIYTRKFYEQIVTGGANTASPLLFPETVYNAPASHLAALLGITGASYTLVGDATAGISAIHYAAELLEGPDLDRVVVVGGEEIDRVLCEAYREWRLQRASPEGPGLLLAEGGAALVLAREGSVAVRRVHPGVPFFHRREAAGVMERVCAELGGDLPIEVAVGSANGTFIDAAERAALTKFFPAARTIFPKAGLGEALGAGALMQTIVAALALEKLPQDSSSGALVTCLGLNQHAAGLVLSR